MNAERTPFERMVAALVIVGALGAAAPSGADTSSDTADSASLQEVLVTATKRSETQLDVPMSVAVLSSQSLLQQEIKTFNDFAAQIPNLSFNYGQAPGANDRGVAIRGVQGADTTGFYLDELPMPISLNPRVLDMDRIEVLRGPQGTLYGARSMGGTIRMITSAPNLTTASATVDVQGLSVDGGGNGYQAYGTFNIPLLSDQLALRVTPFMGEDPGYINREFPNPTTPTQLVEIKNTASNKYNGVLASLLWKPTQDLTLRPSVMYQSAASNGMPLGDYTANNLTNVRSYDIAEPLIDEWLFAGATVNYAASYGAFTSATSVLNRHSSNTEDVSEFTSYVFDTPLMPSAIFDATSTHLATEEIRFVSSWTSPLQFVGGVFYQKTDISDLETQFLPGFVQYFGTPAAYFNWLTTVQQERAVFGELTYAITQKWSATLGARYSQDKQNQGGYEWGVAEGAYTVGNARSNATNESDSVTTPKFLVQYKANEDLNVYADAAKGFRPGSGEVPPPSFCSYYYQQYNWTPQELSSYKPDSLWSYELGTKARTPDHRYSVDAAVFYIDWSDIRENLELAQCGYPVTFNAGKARSRGTELEFSALPLENLTLSGGVGYEDAKIVTPSAIIPVPVAGSPIQQVTPLTGDFSAQFQHPLAVGMDMLIRADYNFVGHSYSSTNSSFGPRYRPPYSLANLRASIQKGPVSCALFIKNLTDAHPNLGDEMSQAGEFPGRPRWETGPPRTYGVEMRVSY